MRRFSAVKLVLPYILWLQNFMHVWCVMLPFPLNEIHVQIQALGYNNTQSAVSIISVAHTLTLTQ